MHVQVDEKIRARGIRDTSALFVPCVAAAAAVGAGLVLATSDLRS